MQTILDVKCKAFAVRIVHFYKFLTSTQKEAVLSKQILRSGTSIGANARERLNAQSNADFINKLEIALKECYETEYWLEILFRVNAISDVTYKSSTNKSGTIRRKLIASITTAKSNMEQREK